MCECLSQIIRDTVHNGSWKPLQLNNAAPSLSHLFLVDDLVLFSECFENQMFIIKDCIDRFYKASSDKTSVEKTKVYFSKNVLQL